MKNEKTGSCSSEVVQSVGFPAVIAAFLICTFILFPFKTMAGIAQDILSESKGSHSYVLYDHSNGLPTSEANAIVQTDEGFIWVGSYGGLIRYDGNEFYRYDSSTAASSVVSLFVDSQKRLWIGTNDSGIIRYEKGEFTAYGRVEGIKSQSIRSVVEDDNGNILIATTLGLSYVSQNNILHPFDNPQLDSQYICELKKGPGGVIYGETLDGNIFLIEDMKVSGYYSGQELGIEGISCVTPDPVNPGYIYIGTETSEIYYCRISDNFRIIKTYDVSPDVTINTVKIINDVIWVCTDSGIGNIVGDKYNSLDKIPMNNSVDDMMEDFEGNLWFVSSRQGVMKLVSNRFIDISDYYNLDPTVVNSTCSYKGQLYLGTDNGLTILGKNQAHITNELTRLLEGIRIRCIKKDSKDELWISTYSDYGLINCHPDGSFDFYNAEKDLLTTKVRSTEELSDGSIAVATSAGVSIVRYGTIVERYGRERGINNTEILSVCEGKDGTLYLGSDGDGIYKVNGSRLSRIGVDNGLKSEVILRIKKQPGTDRYWIVTSNSIAYMGEDDVVTTVSRFPYSNNFDIVFDKNDNIWVLSSSGIYVVTLKQMLSMDDRPMEYTFFDRECGLPCVATANSWNCVDEDGFLYVSGSTGACCININETETGDDSIHLSIPFIGIDDRLMDISESGGEVTIPSSCRKLTIYSYAFSYSLNNPRLSYQLTGFDTEETSVLKRDWQPVAYTNLDGGDYVFTMKVINTLSGTEENSINLKITKAPALHEQQWFIISSLAVITALFLLAAYMIDRKKMAALVKKHEENRVFINQMISAFAKCIDMKDAYTNGHSFRVADYSSILARQLGMSDEEVEDVHNIALLHDIGKISIPDKILNKPGKLDDEEFEIMKSHSANGYEILKDIEINRDLSMGAGYHHERLDGKGYPRGLKGDEIPKVAQIIAVADTFDAMYSTRPYRKKLPIETVLEELRNISGTQLNAEYVEAFIQAYEEGKLKEAASVS